MGRHFHHHGRARADTISHVVDDLVIKIYTHHALPPSCARVPLNFLQGDGAARPNSSS